jgi:hypothetical protein
MTQKMKMIVGNAESLTDKTLLIFIIYIMIMKNGKYFLKEGYLKEG